VVEERDPGPNRGTAFAVDIQVQLDIGFPGFSPDLRPTLFHRRAIKSNLPVKLKANCPAPRARSG
jgi:hypothetical protein